MDDWSSRQTIEKDRRKAVFLFFGIVGGGNEERLTFAESAPASGIARFA